LRQNFLALRLLDNCACRFQKESQVAHFEAYTEVSEACTRDTILVTGGAGFIGSNFILSWMEAAGSAVVNLDLLTYAGNPANLSSLEGDQRYLLRRGDICDAELVGALLREQVLTRKFNTGLALGHVLSGLRITADVARSAGVHAPLLAACHAAWAAAEAGIGSGADQSELLRWLESVVVQEPKNEA